MEKPSTINVVDDGQQLQRDIIKTHLYYLENVNILNDQERGYFYREYFPYMKQQYLSMAPVHSVICNEGIKAVNKEFEKQRILTEKFPFVTDDGCMPETLILSNLPARMVEVRVAKSPEADKRGYAHALEIREEWTVDKSSGVIHILKHLGSIIAELDIIRTYYIIVDYVGVSASAYQVGEDGTQ